VVPALPSGVTLYSRSSNTADGRAVIEDDRPMKPGEVRTLVVEYFAPNVQRFAEPALTLEINSAAAQRSPLGALAAVDRVLTGAGNRTYVEFTTASDRTYWVQYRDGASGVWQTSPTPVSGTGVVIHWLDEGMPKTMTPPTAAREYRLVVATGVVSTLAITAQPQPVQVSAGAPASLRVGLGAGGPYTYQWFRGATSLTNTGPYSGATTATLVISTLASNDGITAGTYTCVVNSPGSGDPAATSIGLAVKAVPHLSISSEPISVYKKNLNAT